MATEPKRCYFCGYRDPRLASVTLENSKLPCCRQCVAQKQGKNVYEFLQWKQAALSAQLARVNTLLTTMDEWAEATATARPSSMIVDSPEKTGYAARSIEPNHFRKF